jgi:cytochrome c553
MTAPQGFKVACSEFDKRCLRAGLWIALLLLIGCAPKYEYFDDTVRRTWQSCLVCHSTVEMQRGPRLEHLPPWYIERQLHKYLRGQRGSNPENRSEFLMGTAVKNVDRILDVGALSRYISQQPQVAPLASIKGDVTNGRAIYKARCAACHNKGEGSRLLKAPPLIGVDDWYLYDQLRKFRDGKRGYHDEDVEGIAMGVGLQGMSDAQFRDIVAFILADLNPDPHTDE